MELAESAADVPGKLDADDTPEHQVFRATNAVEDESNDKEVEP